MMKFKVQGMTSEGYGRMMCGSREYSIREFWVEAETKEKAYEIACKENPELVINTYIESKEEIENYEKALAERRAEAERKEKEKAERKAKREQEKAEEMGLTIEEYNEFKRLERNKKRHEAEMRKHYAAIRNAEKGIKYEEKKIAEYEKMMKKITERA